MPRVARFAKAVDGAKFSGHGIRVEGAAALHDLLDSLPDKVARKILRDALRKAGKTVQAAAKKLAPVDTGLLRRSITVRRSKRAKRGREAVVIFPDVAKFKAKADLGKGSDNRVKQKAADFYAPYVEYGTSSRAAKPYMRPAFDQTKDEVLGQIQGDILKGVLAERLKGGSGQ